MRRRWSQDDRRFMRLALELAARGRGAVEPNPMVGCVLVKAGRIMGRSWHRRFGGPHAEAAALRDAGDAARGATAYVTLEPCSHYGKTPPCADALVRAGVRRVVAAMTDPNPLVAGRGVRRLRTAGVEVAVGLLRAEAMALNAPFVTFHRRKRPYVILKWAQSLDGKIATRTGDSKWITSLAARRAAHRLRARVDGVLVGVDTIIRDDPALTARLARPVRTATRIVLDSTLRTPLDSRVVRTARTTPTVIVTASSSVPRRRVRRFEAAGCRVLSARVGPRGVDLADLFRRLRAMDMTNVLVEGGGRVLGVFVDAGLADEARVFVAPKLIGGEAAPGPLRGVGPASLRSVPRARLVAVERHGVDACHVLVFH